MNFNELNPKTIRKITKMQNSIQEQFGISIKGFPAKRKLEKLAESAENTLFKIRGSNKKFHLEPEYAKFLGLKDLANNMLEEGMYAESPAYVQMKEYLTASVCSLMDSGYTVDEACTEAMNQFRKNPQYAYDDDHVFPIVQQAAEDYYQENLGGALTGARIGAAAGGVPGAVVGGAIGHKLTDDVVESYARATGKSSDAIRQFLENLDENKYSAAIAMFDKKLEESQEDDLDRLIYEDVDVSEAEVVMAARSLVSDIQDQIERIGRMANEDLPAIVDQVKVDMGASTAEQFKLGLGEVLTTYLEAAKTAKESMDQQVTQLAGGEVATMQPSMDQEPNTLDDVLPDEDPQDAEVAVDSEDDVEDNPLGRAEI